MKTGVTPKLEAKWWRDNKAKTLKSTGLGNALVKYERRLADFQKKANDKETPFPEVQEAFDEVKPLLTKDIAKAVNDGIKAAGIFHKETKEALLKYKEEVIPAAANDLINLYGAAQRRYQNLLNEMDVVYEEFAHKFQMATSLVDHAIKEVENYIKVLKLIIAKKAVNKELANKAIVEATMFINKINSTCEKSIGTIAEDYKQAQQRFKPGVLLEADQKRYGKLADTCTEAASTLKKLNKTYDQTEKEFVVQFELAKKKVDGTLEIEQKYFHEVRTSLLALGNLLKAATIACSDVHDHYLGGMKMIVQLGRLEEARSTAPSDKEKEALKQQKALVAQTAVEMFKQLDLDGNAAKQKLVAIGKELEKAAQPVPKQLNQLDDAIQELQMEVLERKQEYGKLARQLLEDSQEIDKQMQLLKKIVDIKKK